MTPKTLLARDPSLLSEAEWSSLVVELANIGGWRLRYHTLRSKGSASGFPDWVFVKGPRLLFVELKTDAKTSKLTPKQEAWREGLLEVERATKGLVQTYVWRPSDYATVVETLTGKRPREEAA